MTQFKEQSANYISFADGKQMHIPGLYIIEEIHGMIKIV